jgi:hypothetical protein
LKLVEHWLLVGLQVIPSGLLVTWPDPVPVSETVNVSGAGENVAVTLCAVFTVTVHVPVPLQLAPDQPAKTDPVFAAAVSVTIVPSP